MSEGAQQNSGLLLTAPPTPGPYMSPCVIMPAQNALPQGYRSLLYVA